MVVLMTWALGGAKQGIRAGIIGGNKCEKSLDVMSREKVTKCSN